MAVRQLCWPPAILFYRCSLDLFSPPNLQGRLADRHQTLPHVRPSPKFITFVRNLDVPFPRNLPAQKTSKLRRDFGQLRDLIANIPGMQQDIVANYGHSRTCTFNSVYFCPQTVKNWTAVLTHQRAIVFFARVDGHQAGHCHASTVPNDAADAPTAFLTSPNSECHCWRLRLPSSYPTVNRNHKDHRDS